MPTLNLQVSAAGDDGSASSAYFSDAGVASKNYLGLYSGVYAFSNWNRFQNVTIPQGATINSASMQLFLSSYTGASSVTVYGNKVANAANPTDNTDYTNKARTSASVSWNIGTPGANSWATSPSLVSVIQEIVNQGTWASGNAMLILLDYVASSFYYQVNAYESGSNAAKLAIDYTASAGPAKPVLFRNHYMQQGFC